MDIKNKVHKVKIPERYIKELRELKHKKDYTRHGPKIEELFGLEYKGHPSTSCPTGIFIGEYKKKSIIIEKMLDDEHHLYKIDLSVDDYIKEVIKRGKTPGIVSYITEHLPYRGKTFAKLMFNAISTPTPYPWALLFYKINKDNFQIFNEDIEVIKLEVIK